MEVNTTGLQIQSIFNKHFWGLKHEKSGEAKIFPQILLS